MHKSHKTLVFVLHKGGISKTIDIQGDIGFFMQKNNGTSVSIANFCLSSFSSAPFLFKIQPRPVFGHSW